MKKRILIIAMLVAMMVCLLVVVSSAEEYEGVYYTLDDDGTATVSTENQTAKTEIVTIPSTITIGEATYKVDAIASSAFNGNKTVKEIRILSVHIKSIPYGMILNTYDGALEKIYIDFSNITSIGSAGFNPSYQSNGNNPQANKFYYYDAKAFLADGSSVKITSPDFSNCTSIGDAAFQGANFEELVIPATLPVNSQTFRMSTIKKLTIQGTAREEIGYWSFNGCASLTEIRIESRNLKKIQSNTFSGLKSLQKIYIDLSNCTSFDSSSFVFSSSYDGGNTTTIWYDLDGNRRVDLSKAKTIKGSAFASSNLGGSGATEIIWPQSLTTLEDQAFRRCNITGTMYLNMDSTVIDKSLPFYNMHENKPSLVILGPSFTKIECQFEVACTVIALADSVEVTYVKTAPFKDSANSTLYCKSATFSHYTVPNIVTITGGTVNYSATCGITADVTTTATETLTFGTATHNYIEGEYDNTVCPINNFKTHTCSKCEGTKLVSDIDGLVPTNHNHNVKFAIDYADYTQNGIITFKCEACDSKITEQEATAQAIFEYLGFSLKADKSGSICIGYSVNETAVNEYALVNTSFTFGVVGYIPVANENPLEVVDGKAVASEPQYTIQADITSQTMSAFDFVIAGFEGNTDVSLVMCAYVCDGESIYYLNIDQATNKVAQSTSTTTFSYDGLNAYRVANEK